MVLQRSAAAAPKGTLRKQCVARLPLLSPEILSLMADQNESMLKAWSGRTWAKLTMEAVGGSDPTGASEPAHAWRVRCTACGMQLGKWKWCSTDD